MNKLLISWVTAFALAVGLLMFSVFKLARLTNASAPTPIVKESIQSEFTVEYFNGGRLLTDNVTGCQYISEYNVGITPRMYSDGIQVCGQSTYPNGEHEVSMDSDGFPPNVYSKNTPE